MYSANSVVQCTVKVRDVRDFAGPGACRMLFMRKMYGVNIKADVHKGTVTVIGKLKYVKRVLEHVN